MPVWFGLLLTLLGWLLQWLLTRASKGERLTSNQAAKLTEVVNLTRRIEAAATSLGVNPPGGIPGES